MTIHIDDSRTLKEIQEEFIGLYPHLKIEFYEHSHEEGQGNDLADQLVDLSVRIKDIRTVHNDGDVKIHGNMKVSTLENQFEEVFGLHVQVFRKSGNIWLQTTATDEWTLSNQEQLAAEREAFNEGTRP